MRYIDDFDVKLKFKNLEYGELEINIPVIEKIKILLYIMSMHMTKNYSFSA